MVVVCLFFLQGQIVIILVLANHSNSVTITQLCFLEGNHPETMFKQMSGRLALINFTKTGSKLQLELELLISVLGKIIKKKKKRGKKTKIGVSNSNILYMTKIF